MTEASVRGCGSVRSLLQPQALEHREENTMSTGLDCRFYEKNPNEWYYELERDYGSRSNPDYDRFGPFNTFKVAHRHLGDNHANPGGWSLDPHESSTDRSWEIE